MLLGTHQLFRRALSQFGRQHWKQTTAKVLSLLICASMLSSAILPALAQQQTASASSQIASSAGKESLNITMKDLGNPDGYTLKTVRTERRYFFTKPKGWKILPSSSVHVAFQHSPSLLAERSALNILVNDRIIKTIRLEDANIQPTEMDIPIPAEIMKDNNSLTFQVDQHYTYDSQDP